MTNADALRISRHARGTFVAETLPARAALLDATYDGPRPASALAALDAERDRIRQLPEIESIQLDIDIARSTLAQSIGIFRALMRARRKARAALRASTLPENQTEFRHKTMDLSAEAKFQFKWVRSGRQMVAWNLARLRNAERAAMQEAAE